MTASDANSLRLCAACLAENSAGDDACTHCRAPLVLGEHFAAHEPLSEKSSARTLGGVDLRDGSSVILKLLSVSGLSEWKELELFQRGIGVLRGLDHPMIPQHLADGEFKRGGETFYYWIQTRIDGPDLASALERGQRWNETRARALAEAMLDLLAYLHDFSPPIIHRDIKPANILERGEGDWVLIDFDLVKDTLDPDGGSTTALGTAGYAPIEQLMGHALPASDLYALGATLVALLSRKEPSDLVDPSVGRIEFRDRINVSDEFAEFIALLLQTQAGDRPQSAHEARELLAEGPRAVAAALPPIPPPAMLPEAEELPAMLVPAEEGQRQLAIARASRKVALAKLDERPGRLVEVEGNLAEKHKAPMWANVARVGLVAASVLLAKASFPVAAAIGAAAWIVGGFVFRWPVILEEGRALYRGGISHESSPGRYWLRKRFWDTPYSVNMSTYHLRWRPASAKIESKIGEVRWLDLEVNLWMRPTREDVGQFGAVLKIGSWANDHDMVAYNLRESFLEPIVEAMGVDELWEASAEGPVDVTPHLRSALAVATDNIGFEIVAHGEHKATLGPRSEDPRVKDVARLKANSPAPLPPAESA